MTAFDSINAELEAREREIEVMPADGQAEALEEFRAEVFLKLLSLATLAHGDGDLAVVSYWLRFINWPGEHLG